MIVRGGRAFSYAVGGGFLAALVSFVVLSRGGDPKGGAGGGAGRDPIVAVPEDAAGGTGGTGVEGAVDEVVEGAMLPARSFPGKRPANRLRVQGVATSEAPSTEARHTNARKTPPRGDAASTLGAQRAVEVPAGAVHAGEPEVTSVSASVVRLGDTRVGRQDGAPVAERRRTAHGRVPEEDTFLALLSSSEATLARAQRALRPEELGSAPRKAGVGVSGVPGDAEATRRKALARGAAVVPGAVEMERECQRASILGSMPPSYCSCDVGEFEQLECRVSKAVVRN